MKRKPTRPLQLPTPPPDLSNATADGSPGNITLVGKTYLVAQPTLADCGAIAAKLKKQIKTPVEELQADPGFQALPPEEQRPILAETYRHFTKHRQEYLAGSLIEQLFSLGGVRFTAWVLLRQHQPDMTLERIAELITEENCDQVAVELAHACGMAALGNLAGLLGS